MSLQEWLTEADLLEEQLVAVLDRLEKYIDEIWNRVHELRKLVKP